MSDPLPEGLVGVVFELGRADEDAYGESGDASEELDW